MRRPRSKSRLLNRKHTPEQADAADKQIAAITAEYEEIQGQIRARSPRYAALTQPQPLGLTEIQQQAVDEDTLLLEYALGKERSYLWLVSHRTIDSYELPPAPSSNRRPPGLRTAHRAPETLDSARSAIHRSGKDAQRDVAWPGGSATRRANGWSL